MRGVAPPPAPHAARRAAPAPPASARPPLIAAIHRWRTPQGRARLALLLLSATILLDILLVGRHTLARYQGYRAEAFDLGNMDQAVWNTLHGSPFRFTNRGLDTLGPPTRLAIHVEPILLLLAPLYLIHSGPETLLILQTIALALGALPLYRFSRRHLPDHPLLALFFPLSYLLAPELLGMALWDFHPVALATPLLLLALWALDSRRLVIFAAAAALAALTKEDVALSLIPLGLYCVLWLARPRLGSAVILLAIAWVATCFLIILPHFNTGVAAGNNYWYRYAHFGATPRDALVNILTHPWLLPAYVLGDAARRGYLALILGIGGGLSLLAPLLWFCALPELAVNILSSHWEQYSGFYQYNALLLPYLCVASVLGSAALLRARQRATHPPTRQPPPHPTLAPPRWLTPIRRRLLRRATQLARWRARLLARIPLTPARLSLALALWLILAIVWNLHAAGPRVLAFWTAGDHPAPQVAQVNALLARIPPNASVGATDTLDPHLSDRYTLYLLPDPQCYTADYIAANVTDATAFLRAQDAAILQRMLASGHYVVIGHTRDVIVLHRVGAPLTPSAPASGAP